MSSGTLNRTLPTYLKGTLHSKSRLRYDLLCVEWDVKAYTLTHPPLKINPRISLAALKVYIFVSYLSQVARL